MKKYYLPIAISTMVAFLFTIVTVYGATTISTNINTGGTLTVSGASVLSSTLAVTGATTLTGAAALSSTLTVTGTSALNDTVTIAASKGLVLGSSATDLTGSAGMVYYDSTNKSIKLYDGANWFTVGTTTTGVQLSGQRVALGDLTTQYMTFGTTTQTGLSVLTLTATTTTSIPLTIRGEASQTANLLQVQNILGTELFALDFAGNASTTMLTSAGNIWVDGILTVAGNSVQASADIGGGYNTLGTGSGITLSTAGKIQLNSDLEVNGYATTTASNGNFNTNGSIAIASTTPAQELTVTGDAYFGSAATTTLHIKSTAASTGGCVEIEGANDTIYRFYATTTGPIILEAGVCQ